MGGSVKGCKGMLRERGKGREGGVKGCKGGAKAVQRACKGGIVRGCEEGVKGEGGGRGVSGCKRF